MQNAQAFYEEGREKRASQLSVLERRAVVVASARLVVALTFVGSMAGVVWFPLGGLSATLLGTFGVVFVGLVILHARIYRQKDHAAASLRFHERGLARLSGQWSRFSETGATFAPGPDHPFADDLDIFGRNSLFQLVCAAETRAGGECLAEWLSNSNPTDMGALRARQEAVRELAANPQLREELSALAAQLTDDLEAGPGRRPDPVPFFAWAEKPSELPTGAVVRGVAWLVPMATLVAWFLAPYAGWPRAWAIVPFAIGLGVLAWFRKPIALTLDAALTQESSLSRYAPLFSRLERAEVQSARLLELRRRFVAPTSATTAMSRLARIASFAEARSNEVFRFLIAPVLLWDLHCAVALERWRFDRGGSVREWFSALAEIEALASLAGFCFERPDHAWPELVDELRLEAKELGHPLIASERRVGNDVAIEGPGRTLLVTGSNMSGKSTLLRAVGINMVLARAGAPVCARRFVACPVDVLTSMRVRDSLEEGVSRFFAEVRRLKQVLDAATRRPILFLLDEILHGTNSRERLIGARALVRELVRRGSIGAVSTHDLALSDLEEKLDGRARNVHFEEQVAEGTMTFDYRLREGPVKSSNALHLMRAVGLDLPYEESG